MQLRPLAASVALTLAACTSSTPGGSGGAVQRYDLQFTTAAGQETHWCQYARMPQGDGKDVVVTGYDWSWENMHHWALYRTTANLPANVSFDQPFDCFQPGGMAYAAPASLVLGGGAQGDLTFPEGTGFGFAPGEVVIFQAHTLNTTAAPLVAKIDVGVHTADPATVTNRLALIQFYDPYIVVPAHTEARAAMRCRVPSDITVVQATTHQHTRGIGVQVFLDPAAGAPATTPLVASTDWQHPNTVAGPLQLPAGAHVRTHCNYLGDDHDVIQGQDKTDNEMCMFVGYYYPALPPDAAPLFENCVQDSVPQGVGDQYGTGAMTCSQALTCIQGCPAGDAPNPHDGRIDVGKCWQGCLVGSCATAAEPLNQLGACVQDKCAAACSGGDCASCVVASCANEYGACQSSTCPAASP